MRKTILIAAATLAMGLAGQAQAFLCQNGITTHGMGVATTVQGITLPGGEVLQGVVVDD